LNVLNPWMLIGLAALAVPILIHLLSRRRQEVVDWGAMQFLEPSPKARRALLIENVLLLLVRMALVAIVAFALARPWLEWPWLARWLSSRPQDVAVIVDGSDSLDRSEGPRTLADRLRRTTKGVLNELDASDVVQIYDARETPQPVLPSYQRDKAAAWERVLDLPPVSGSADLVSALTLAAQDLVQGTTLDRDIVILTDGQARSWRLGDTSSWDAFVSVQKQSAIKARIWAMEIAPEETAATENVAIAPLELSKELVTAGTRVRIETRLRARDNAESLVRNIQLHIDGRAVAEQAVTVRLPPNGDAPASFEWPFERPGCHVVELVIAESDLIAADNRAAAVVEVGQGWPVLLIDGGPNDDPTKAETFFLAAALDPTGTGGGMLPKVVSFADWEPESLNRSVVIVLANVADLTDEHVEALDEYLQNGGAVVVTLGDQIVPTTADEPTPLAKFVSLDFVETLGQATVDDTATTLQADSLELPWQQRFRRQRLGGVCETRIRQWWRVAIRSDEDRDSAEEPRLMGRFQSGDPALIEQRRGRGTLAVWTSTVDADWNALPSRPDYVPWWHELLLSLIMPPARRNVSVGESLLALNDAGQLPLEGEFLGPWSFRSPGEPAVLGERHGRRLNAARWPGMYLFSPTKKDQDAPTFDALLTGGDLRDAYAVRRGVGESELLPLTPEDKAALERNHGVRFVANPAELGEAWLGDAARLEFAALLLYLFLAFLIVESWLTRRMVKRGTGVGE
jgi:hypothetical protein